ncbi:MAG: COX15/CtaA family protein [Gammaproteobacteria bacterium]|nr:COX15/CtaA family protein [Gammaproteobacteria bacterium]
MKWFSRLALLASMLAWFVVILGAFVRLSDAGLGCPDWPVCYGHLAWPTAEEHVAAANEAYPERPVEVHKAWKEQVHRHLAAMLGVLVLTLALMASWSNSRRRGFIITSAVTAAAGTVLYIVGWPMVSLALSAVAIGLPLYGLFSWKDDWHARHTAGLLALIIFQAMLGMWTVTMLVKPIIVTAHLLGGMATWGLLWLLYLRSRGQLAVNTGNRFAGLRTLTFAALVAVIVQIYLGGWTSTNYAALACPDFPTCQGEWLPAMDLAEGFKPWRGLGVDYEGGVLENEARVGVHYVHRLGAIAVLLIVGSLVFRARRAGQQDGRLRLLGASVGVLLVAQVLLGISVVKYGLPLWLAVAHNGTAALLLASLITLAYALRPVEQ